jgi:predicted O-linked N-acetylglucosamine transferase (SPINDLY family)
MLMDVHQRSPGRLDAVQLLAMARQSQGDLQGAVTWLHKAMAIRPDSAEPAANYLRVLKLMGNDQRFSEGLQDVLLRFPRHAEIAALAYELDPKAKAGDAHLTRLEAAIAADEAGAMRSVFVCSTWCKALCTLGKHRDAEKWMLRALEVDPHNPQVASANLLLACAWSHWSPARLHEAHVQVQRRLDRAAPIGVPAMKIDPAVWPDRRLRIGYITADAKKHSAAHFMHPLFAHHDRARFAVHLYMNVKASPGDVTEMITQHCEKVRTVVGEHERVVAEQIIEDQVDVLIDLGGYTAQTGVWLLRHRLAPTQMTYLGYPHSTGMSTIDGRIVDAITDPAGSEAFASEKLVRMPGCFLCYSGLGMERPVRQAVPARADDRAVTFGSFNALHKYSEQTVRVWAKVLRAVPGSRLICKARDLESRRRGDALAEAFAREGIERDRLELIGHVESRAEHLALYSRIDVALDTMPYNGTTTTIEALLMGTPVVTMLGDRHAARVSASLLTAAGAAELIAADEEDFAVKAGQLAIDRTRLTGYQTKLPQQVLLGQLGDGRGFMHRFEEAVVKFHLTRATG